MDAEDIYEALVDGEYQRLRERWESWNDGPLSPEGGERLRAAARWSVDQA